MEDLLNDQLNEMASEESLPIVYDFKAGELIIPNDDLQNAFHYSTLIDLDPDIDYRVANSAEYTFYNKKKMMGETEIKSIEGYKSQHAKTASDAYAQVEKSRQPQNF